MSNIESIGDTQQVLSVDDMRRIEAENSVIDEKIFGVLPPDKLVPIAATAGVFVVGLALMMKFGKKR